MDVVLLGFIAGFIYGGYRSGFLKRLFGIAFAVISLLVTAYFRYPVAAIASTLFKSIPEEYAQLVAAVIVFPAVLAILHLVSRKTIERIHVQGLTKQLDGVLGAILGGVEAVVILSALVVIVDAYFGTGSTAIKGVSSGPIKDLVAAFNASETVRILRDTTVPIVLAILGPFLPKDLKSVAPAGVPGLPLPSGLPIP
jgi:uncharacterized membrane protein required for colicin V production